MNSKLNCLNDSQLNQNEIGPNAVINANTLRDQLMHYTLDKHAIQVTRIKKGKGNGAKV